MEIDVRTTEVDLPGVIEFFEKTYDVQPYEVIDFLDDEFMIVKLKLNNK